MKLYRLQHKNHGTELSGFGAFLHGGRWNSEGKYAIYCAASVSMAIMELMAYAPLSFIIENYKILTIECPSRNILEINMTDLAEDWKNFPATNTTKQTGNRWLSANEYLLMRVPSVLIQPYEYNFVINPNHALFSKVKVIQTDYIYVDQRMPSFLK